MVIAKAATGLPSGGKFVDPASQRGKISPYDDEEDEHVVCMDASCAKCIARWGLPK